VTYAEAAILRTDPVAHTRRKVPPPVFLATAADAGRGYGVDRMKQPLDVGLLHADKDKKKTLALRRYILGPGLVAFTHKPGGYLRQGCLLVLDPDRVKENEFVEVHPSGERKPAKIAHDDALKYATEAASAFGVGEGRTVQFDPERAKRDVRGEGEARPARAARRRRTAGSEQAENPPTADN
jgi:hypothetical protein